MFQKVEGRHRRKAYLPKRKGVFGVSRRGLGDGELNSAAGAESQHFLLPGVVCPDQAVFSLNTALPQAIMMQVIVGNWVR